VGSIITLIFIDEEIEAQKALIIFTRPNNGKWRSSKLPGSTTQALKTQSFLSPKKFI
jgi:hypothetical protein